MITPNIQVTINLQNIDKDKPKDVRTHIKSLEVAALHQLTIIFMLKVGHYKKTKVMSIS